MRARCVRSLSVEERAGLEALYQRGKSHLERRRAHFLLLSDQGQKLCAAARLVGISLKTAGYTLRRCEQHGVAVLREHPRQGRPSALTPALGVELDGVLQASPREQGFPTNNWTGPVLVAYLKQKHSLVLSADQARRWMHQLGFRRVRPRPRLAKGDREAKNEGPPRDPSAPTTAQARLGDRRAG